MTLVDKIRWQCRSNGELPALSLPSSVHETVSYAQLDYHLNNASQKLRLSGVVPGTLYGLHLKDTLLHLVLTLALEELGAATVSVHQANLPRDWKLGAIFSDEDVAESTSPILRVDQGWLHGDGTPLPSAETHGRSPTDPCRVVVTSGSTGTPKGVVLTHGTVAQRIAQFDDAFGETFAPHPRIMCLMVIGSNIEYRFCIYTLSHGGLYCLRAPSVKDTLRKLSFHNIQTLVASGTTLRALLSSPQASKEQLRSLELILTSGAPLPRLLAQELRANLCDRIVTFYGLTEAGIVAAARAETLDLDAGEVGIVVPGVKVDFVNRETKAAAEKDGGTLRVRSDCIASGYLGRLGEDPAFGDNAFHSGDLGSLSRDGRLSIHGRNSNVVNIGGDKTTLEAIELGYAMAPGIRDVAAAVAPDRLGMNTIVAVIVTDDQWSKRKFLDYCRANRHRVFLPRKLVISPSIPRNLHGKVDRQKLSLLVNRTDRSPPKK